MSHSEERIETQLSCRGHEEADSLSRHDGFPLPGDKPRYPRDRQVEMKHARLDIRLDLDEKRVAGSVAHTFSPVNDGVSSLDLDAVELEIDAVELADGIPLQFSLSDGRLHIKLDRPHSPGEELTVVVAFSGTPRRGLYFIGPSEEYPNKRLEAWTQGQDEDSRHWFPSYDYPNEMATSEIHVTVREPFIARLACCSIFASR